MSKSLFSVTPDPMTGGGIFSALQSLNPPWADEDIALQLDLVYYGNISGGKVVSPLIDRLLVAENLTTLDIATLAGVLMATNKERWEKEWATRSAEYDPIENYRMTEEMTDDETVTEYGRTHTRTDNLAHTETRTDNLTRTIDNIDVTTPNLTTTKQRATRAFNSSSDVDTDKETTTNTGTSRVSTDGSERNTGTQGTTGSDTGTQTDADTGSDTSTRNYTLTRSGNIGVTTSQQMLQSERDLWMWSYFYDVVFPDVDEVLTIPVYADDEDTDGTGGGIIPTGTIPITANGEYDVTNYARAAVNVPNTYGPDDNWKVVQNGVLLPQTAMPSPITQNGLWDTRPYGEVRVDVAQLYTPVNISGLYSFTPTRDANSARTAGYMFRTSQPYKIAGIMFFARDAECNVYLSDTAGNVLKQVLGAVATPGSWNNILFDEPYTVTPNTDYMVYGSNASSTMKYQSGTPKEYLITMSGMYYATTIDTYPTSRDVSVGYGIDLIINIGV